MARRKSDSPRKAAMLRIF